MKTKILLIRPFQSSFIHTDLELLKKHFNIRDIEFILSRKNFKITIIALYKLILGIIWADVTFTWFADTHAYLAVKLSKLFKKKSIVIASGYSVANMPELGFGAMTEKKTASRVKFVLGNATKILAVSDFNRKEILQYTHPRNVTLVYHGLDYTYFEQKGEKEDLVLTVGHVLTFNLKRKGLETFVRAACYLPTVRFALIGKHMDDSINYLKSIAPSNVLFTDYVSDEDLLTWYQRAKVYVQVSAHEAFGMSLAESMLCECIPVVTARGAIPEVVGDTGFYVPYGDPEATVGAIEAALKSDKGREARERIKTLFPLEKREQELVRLIKEV